MNEKPIDMPLNRSVMDTLYKFHYEDLDHEARLGRVMDLQRINAEIEASPSKDGWEHPESSYWLEIHPVYNAGLVAEVLLEEVRRLKDWKRQALAVTAPVFEFKHPEMKPGDSKIQFLLRLARERDEMKRKGAR